VFGRIEMLGRVCPREVSALFVGLAVVWLVCAEGVSKLEEGVEVACRARIPVDKGGLDVEASEDSGNEEMGASADSTAERALGLVSMVVLVPVSAFGTEDGTVTGQKLHTCLHWSQYKSISNLRKPTASRFERQSAELSSSYLRRGKQAAEKETPGVVT
jgi:hypothetical protein